MGLKHSWCFSPKMVASFAFPHDVVSQVSPVAPALPQAVAGCKLLLGLRGARVLLLLVALWLVR